MDEHLESLDKACILSMLDVNLKYYNIKVDGQNKGDRTFPLLYRQYIFVKLLCSLIIALSTFLRPMIITLSKIH